MLLTSPAFLFLFLPCALLVYTAMGQRHRRAGLLLICLAFHALLHISSPWNLLFLPLLTLYTYGAGRLLSVRRNAPLAVILSLLPYLLLFSLRLMAYGETEGFVYPVGLTVSTIFSTSYLVTQYRGEGESRGGFFNLLLYLSFFPVMLVGPVIRYPDFVRATSSDNISFTLPRVASGMRLFAIGFVKRIGVGAVLFETYELFLYLFGESPDLVVCVILLVLIYFSVFFTVSGYLDMGVGLSHMLGLSFGHEPMPEPFFVATFRLHLQNLFGGLMAWVDDYLIIPLGKKRRRRGLMMLYRNLCYSVIFFLFVRVDLTSVILALIFWPLLYIGERFYLIRRMKSTTLRAVFSILTGAVVGIAWIFITFGDVESVVSFWESIRMQNVEYRIDFILASFSLLKYILVMVIGALCVFLGRYELKCGRTQSFPQTRGGVAARYASMLTVLGLFLLTVMLFLPQYAVYDTAPFLHLYI